jgi:hypothetical protein
MESGAKQSHILWTSFLKKCPARNRLRNLAEKDEIAALLPRESLAMTI